MSLESEMEIEFDGALKSQLLITTETDMCGASGACRSAKASNRPGDRRLPAPVPGNAVHRRTICVFLADDADGEYSKYRLIVVFLLRKARTCIFKALLEPFQLELVKIAFPYPNEKE